jgi:hypothetical protein
MFPTLEVRWFYRGAVPPEVDAWFQRGPGKVERHPSREDHYLRITDTDALGIKLREGRVEVKQRAHEHGTLRFHERVSGAVEHWRKWSFQLAAARSALSSIAVPPTPWIAVRKRRLLRTYRLTTDKCVVPVSTPQNIGQACELELTSVRVVGQDWWTLAFEAFGDESALKEQLVLVARHVFAVDEAPSFHAPESCGYADWLRRITQKEEAK